jgi:hypothetical protein
VPTRDAASALQMLMQLPRITVSGRAGHCDAGGAREGGGSITVIMMMAIISFVMMMVPNILERVAVQDA